MAQVLAANHGHWCPLSCRAQTGFVGSPWLDQCCWWAWLGLGCDGGLCSEGCEDLPSWVTWQCLPHLLRGPVGRKGVAAGPCLGGMLSVGHG